MTSKFELATLQTRHTIYSPNYGGELTVVQLSYGKVDADDVLAGTAKPIAAVVTADGRSYLPEWHTGPESGDAVYVERHDETGCAFHGWIDSISRRIVQAG